VNFIFLFRRIYGCPSATSSIELEFLGIRADAGYGSSVKYLDVKPNNALKNHLKSRRISCRIQYSGYFKIKNRKQIEKILRKEEMTNRDMIRLSNLMKGIG
jgi:hypothetical protein